MWLFPSAWTLLLTTCGINKGNTSSVSPGQRRAPCQWTSGLLVGSSSSDTSEYSEGLIPHLHCSPDGCHQTPQPADFRCFPTDCYRYHSEGLNLSLKVSNQHKEDDSSYL